MVATFLATNLQSSCVQKSVRRNEPTTILYESRIAFTAFPFNPPFMVPQRKDSSTSSSGSGPDTPESMEVRKMKQTSRGLAAMSNSLHHRGHRDSDHQASISIPR